MRSKTTRAEGVLVPGGWEEFGRVHCLVLETDDDRSFRIDGRRGLGRELLPYVGKYVWVVGYGHSGNAISVTSYGFGEAPSAARDERRRGRPIDPLRRTA